MDVTSLTSRLAIVEDARTPQKYRILLSTVDVIFADVAQPDSGISGPGVVSPVRMRMYMEGETGPIHVLELKLMVNRALSSK